MSQEELTIERALEIISAGAHDLQRFYEHYLCNPGVFLAIAEKADERDYHTPRKLVRELITTIGRELSTKDNGDISDAAVSLKLLIDIIWTEEDAGPNDVPSVDANIIPPQFLPSDEFVEALLFNFHYRMFPKQT